MQREVGTYTHLAHWQKWEKNLSRQLTFSTEIFTHSRNLRQHAERMQFTASGHIDTFHFTGTAFDVEANVFIILNNNYTLFYIILQRRMIRV